MKIDNQMLNTVIEYLKNTKSVECNPYPVYSKEIYQALGMLPTDINYLFNHEKLEGKEIETMNRKEIATMLTFIMRGERFCDGHIASYIESGELLRLMLRLKEIEK